MGGFRAGGGAFPWNRAVAICTRLHTHAADAPPVTPTVVLLIVAPLGGALPAADQPPQVRAVTRG